MLNLTSSFKSPVESAGFLIARIILGSVLIAHGWQKFNEWTIAGTTEAFNGMGVPAAGIAAPIASVVELVGGILILIGLITRIAAGLVVLQMIGAGIWGGHFASGVMIDGNGWELVMTIAAGAVIFLTAGPGQYAADRFIFKNKEASVKPPVAA
ncbi:MAG: DoxX family protein [Corynebacterium casei]|nr:DoxX family protein [Corynebacterium casei]